MEITDEERWQSYFYNGENVLKNKLNIHNEQLLKLEEYKIVTKKNALLYLSNIESNFDVEHLKSIHKYLFDSIYPFAGEFRTVNIAKGNKASFSDYRYIELYLKEVLSNLDKIIDTSSHFFYAESLAKVYNRLIDIHPFREGNGRTIREFLREYVEAKNKELSNFEYKLNFELSDIDKEKLLEATKSDTNGYLTIMFYEKLLKQRIKGKKL